jgi:hypothetical protein
VAELIALCTLNKTWNLKGQALLLHYPWYGMCATDLHIDRKKPG